MDRTMASELKALRRRVMEMEAGRGRRYSRELRSSAARVVAAARKAGWSWDRVSEELGISDETLRRWERERGRGSEPGLARVVIRDDHAQMGGAICVVSPSGYRVEGLSIEEAATLLRALS